MAVVVFRGMYYDQKGTNISWRLHGQALPQGSIPIRFILDDKPKLKVIDILAVEDGSYRQSIDRATALGLLDNIIEDLCDRSPDFWDEYIRFIAEHLPEVVPLAVKDLSKSKMEMCYLEMLSRLVKVGANVNFVLDGKTALEYATEIHNTIPYEWMSGNRDHARNVIVALQEAGALTAGQTTNYEI